MKFPAIPIEASDEPSIQFTAADVDLPVLDEASLSSWLTNVAKAYGKSICSLSYVLCSDAYLLEMNVERLGHNTYTDIITFDLGDAEDTSIEGECYISIERVSENAANLGEPLEVELLRVIVHGLLHLCGLSDRTEEETQEMRAAENRALSLLVH